MAVKERMSSARKRVLDKAERLFHEQGYSAVSMRDVADGLGVRQASLYYHVPEGKEQLFVEVTRRSLARHRAGLETAVQTAAHLQAQLEAVAAWFLSQPPLNLFSMLESDMATISAEKAQQLTAVAYDSLFQPLVTAFEAARARGEIRDCNPHHLAGAFLTILEGVMYVGRARHTTTPTTEIAAEMIDILLNGLRPWAHNQPESTEEAS